MARQGYIEWCPPDEPDATPFAEPDVRARFGRLLARAAQGSAPAEDFSLGLRPVTDIEVREK